MKTTLAKPGDAKQWYVVDASGEILGRLAVKIANVLRGRHKPTYTPHIDAGDYVVVINAAKVRLTGNKERDKVYMSYTGWVGGDKYRSVGHYRSKNPAFIIENAVRGMLPRNKLSRAMLSKLKVYPGTEHPHESQQPKPLV